MKNIPVPTALFDNMQYMNDADSMSGTGYELNNECVAKDYQHACRFLISYRGSEPTFRAYRREIERLLQWAWLVAKKNLPEIKREDIELFIEFCQAPPADWIGLMQVPRFFNSDDTRVANPQWRPFVATISKSARQTGKLPTRNQFLLSQNALQAIFAITGSFFNYLIEEEYISVNPVSQMRQKSKFLRKQRSARQVRRLSELQWSYVIETAESLAHSDPNAHERTLFIMSALFGMYLRISELVATSRWIPQMGDFKKDIDGNWWFTTVGKGNKVRDITVSDAMLTALKRYRNYLGLSPLPYPGETTPLITVQRGKGPVTSTRNIRKIVQDCFDAAIARLNEDGFEEDAIQLTVATVHWLRHTGISEDVKTRPREHVRDDAGHSSSAITDRYIDIELRERHASARKKQIRPD